MGAIDLLRKLGILRFGTYKGTYTSAQDMPSEIFMDDVYDAKKDLVSKEDFKKINIKTNSKKLFCRHCGAEMGTDANFCGKCGKSLSDERTYVPSTDTDVQASPGRARKKMALWKKILMGTGIFIVLFIVLVIVLASLATSDLLIPVNNQLTALRNNDIKTAYNETSTAFKKATSLYTFKRFIKAYPGIANNKDADFSERRFKNNMGYVRGTLIAQDGSFIPIEYQLVKENDEWKILSVKILRAEK